MIEDVVCGRMLSEDGATYSSQYRGHTRDFCSLTCKNRFELSPEEFLLIEDSGEYPRMILLGAVA
jgi:YHS domain-containing protein